jgi:carotenoid 1,2-hydratase
MTALSLATDALDGALHTARALDAVHVGDESPGAYQWWYFDALSDDGRFSVVSIIFIGGIFSPLYSDRIAAGVSASPMDHPMVNLVVRDRGRRLAWVFSEYPREHLKIRDPDLDFSIGASRLRRLASGAYEVMIDDDDLPAGHPVSARLRLTPEGEGFAPPECRLSPGAPHFWATPAPRCRVHFQSASLGLEFEGTGYHDVNMGRELLHLGMREWSWGRAHLHDEDRIFYDAMELSGTRTRWLLAGRDGRYRQVPLGAPPQRRRTTAWLLRIPDWPAELGLVPPARTLESSPFYRREAADFRGPSTQGSGIVEYLDFTRWARPSVRFMIRYRVYRRPAPGSPPLPPRVSARAVFPHDPS